MANPEHVKIVGVGVKAIEVWTRQNFFLDFGILACQQQTGTHNGKINYKEEPWRCQGFFRFRPDSKCIGIASGEPGVGRKEYTPKRPDTCSGKALVAYCSSR